MLALLAIWAVRRSPGRRWPAGALGAYALSLAAVFLLSFTRGDPAPLLRGYRSDVVGAALVLVAATGAWVYRLARGTPPPLAPASDNAPSPEPPDASTAANNSVFQRMTTLTLGLAQIKTKLGDVPPTWTPPGIY